MLYLTAYAFPLFLVLVAIPMALGVVPPNGFYGFRTGKTRSSPAIWYPANRFAGWALIAAGLGALAFNWILLELHRNWPAGELLAWMGAAIGGLAALGVAASFLYLRRLSGR